MSSDSDHVPLDALWEYHTTKRPLTKEQLTHAIECRQCVSILSMCAVCPTLEDVKAIAEKEYGIQSRGS